MGLVGKEVKVVLNIAEVALLNAGVCCPECVTCEVGGKECF